MKTTVLIMVVLMFAGSAMADTVAYWRFEGDLTDETGNHDGTWEHKAYSDCAELGATTPVYRDPCGNPVPQTLATNTSSLSINYADWDNPEYMEAPGTDLGTAMTVECRIRLNDDEAAAGGYILMLAQSYEDTDAKYPPFWIEHDPGRGFVFGMRTDKTGGYGRIDSGVHPEVGVCHCVVAVYDPDDVGAEMKLYIDGTEHSASNDFGLISNDEPFIVGAKRYGDACPYSWNDNSDIDEVRISNVALDPSEFLCVPEPATVGLLCVGGLLALLRRRRK